MEFIVLICIFFIILFFLVSKKNYTIKNTLQKKEEIIHTYEQELIKLLQNTKDKQKQIDQKKLFLQKCNSELSRNIFFTEKEAIEVIQRLSKL